MTEGSPSTSNDAISKVQPFRVERLVRFADCDPAGIVFYPRYMEMFNGVIEDWLRDGVGFSFANIFESGWGLPTVHLDVDFVTPSYMGDTVSAHLSVTSLGRSSITLEVVVSGSDRDVRVRGKVVLVLIDAKNKRSIEIPNDLKAKLVSFCVS